MGANADLARRGRDAFRRQDMATMSEMIADDTVWHVAGRSPIAGTYKGRDAVFGLFAKLGELTNGTFSLEERDFTDSDEHSVVLSRATAQRGDRTLDANFIEVVRWRNGQAVEEWAVFEDQYAADEFLSS
jgi:ketosteroid isomerase-like protein